MERNISKLPGSELILIWDNVVYFYNTLYAALLYEVLVLEFWNLTQWMNTYFRCATLRFQFLMDQKMSKLPGSELISIWNNLGYLYNTLYVASLYEALVLGFLNFTQWINLYWICATSRCHFDGTKNVKVTGSELDEFEIPRKMSHMSVGNRIKLNLYTWKSCLLHGESCLTVV